MIHLWTNITTTTATTTQATTTFATTRHMAILFFLGEQHRTKRFNGRFNHLKATNITCNERDKNRPGNDARACVRAESDVSVTREREKERSLYPRELITLDCWMVVLDVVRTKAATMIVVVIVAEGCLNE